MTMNMYIPNGGADCKPRVEHAVEMAALGFRVFPCGLDTEPPDVAKEPKPGFLWKEKATRDPAVIRRWFEAVPNRNYGMVIEDGRIVFDCDHKPARIGLQGELIPAQDGYDTLDALTLMYGDLPPTLTVKSPSGGHHVHMLGEAPNSVKKKALGGLIDVRSTKDGRGGYVLGPGSSYGGKPYALIDASPLAPAPDWLLELANHTTAVALKRPEGAVLDGERAVAHVRRHLQQLVDDGDVAIEGDGGDDRTYRLFCDVLDYVSPEVAYDLVAEIWNPACVPPWDDSELATKCANAANHRQNDIGAKAPDERPASEVFKGYLDKLPPGKDQPKRFMTMQELEDGDFAPSDWLIENLVLEGTPNLCYGEGGAGKTFMMLEKAICIAAGIPFLGKAVKQGRALLVVGEDKEGDTRARMRRICAKYDLRLRDLPIKIHCAPGLDIVLANVSDTGEIDIKPFYNDLDAELREFKPIYVGLDNLTDISNMHESQRYAANAFLKQVCGSLCNAHQTTVEVLAHPSIAGIESGRGYSGTTAFHNAVRARTVLEKTSKAKGDCQRKLSIAKAQYGGEGEIDLWLLGDGFYISAPADTTEANAELAQVVLDVTLGMIERGLEVGGGPGWSHHKAKDIAKELAEKCGRRVGHKEIDQILKDLVRAGKLKLVSRKKAGPYGKAGYRPVNEMPEEARSAELALLEIMGTGETKSTEIIRQMAERGYSRTVTQAIANKRRVIKQGGDWRLRSIDYK
jgi:hypothetical protein